VIVVNRPLVRHAALGAAVVIGTAHVAGSVHTGDLPGNGDSWALGLTAVAQTALGWVVIGRQPSIRTGWLLLWGGAFGTTTFFASWWAREALVHDPGSLPFGPFAAWWSTWSAALPVGMVVAAPLLLFPNGVPRSARWRWFLIVLTVPFAALVLGSAVVAAVVASRTPLQLADGAGVARSSTADLAEGLSAFAWLLAFGSAAVGVGGIVFARRREEGQGRAQYTTVLVGVAVLLVSIVVTSVAEPVTGHHAPEAAGAVAWLGIPIAVAVAIVRYRLYDLRVLVGRSILVIAVGAVLTGAYFAVLVVVARIAGNSTSISPASFIAAACVGLLSAFAATGIAANARRWFGRATGVHVVAERFDDGHQAGDNAAVTLQRLAVTVREELHLGSVLLALDGADPVCAGESEGPTTTIPLQHAGRRSGQLAVTARRGESLSGRDHELLGQIGRYVALTADAIRTSDELRAAQQALQNAHGDERRRLRMDLHDGLGPTLAAIRLKLIAHARSSPDPQPVNEIAEQASDAIREVRRIVDGLQPSLLEDLGLVPAVQILIADASRATGIVFSLDASTGLADLPTAVTTAAYRVISEGVANTARHSGASTCRVSLALHNGRLAATVEDDGEGFDPTRSRGGMGLQSIHARASELGGNATVRSTIGKGTLVAARFPVSTGQ
jgi:signal transduction histidine kinase